MRKLLLTLALAASMPAVAADDMFEGMLPGEWHDMLRDASVAYDKQDFSKAFELNQRASCAGDKTSQAILGRMYMLGQGTQKDAVTGYAWIRLAADYPYAEFTSLARKLEAAMTPEQLKAGEAKVTALRSSYGLSATNVSCRGESRRGVYLIDQIVCTPESIGGKLQVHVCVDGQKK